MDDILNRLRHLGLSLNHPATPERLAAAEDGLGIAFSQEVAALFRDHDGQPPGGALEYRLMPLDEVEETHSFMKELSFMEWMEPLGGRMLWTNDNSDYAGVFLRPSFANLVFILEHDGEPFRLHNRSVKSFYEDLLRLEEAQREAGSDDESTDKPFHEPTPEMLAQAYIDDGFRLRHPRNAQEYREAKGRGKLFMLWGPHMVPNFSAMLREMPGDFPGPGLMPLQAMAADAMRVTVLRRILDTLEDADNRPAVVGLITCLTPLEESQTLIPFLHDVDFFVGECAAKSLGLRNWTPARDALEQLATHGVSNAKNAALTALASLGPTPSIDELKVRLPRLNGQELVDSMTALSAAGCLLITRGDASQPHEIRLQKPGNEQWLTVRNRGAA